MIREPVALRKESVDRNQCAYEMSGQEVLSLSARRAWIEMDLTYSDGVVSGSLSARRAWIEISVKDLNAHLYYHRSLSARRAWIEIGFPLR